MAVELDTTVDELMSLIEDENYTPLPPPMSSPQARGIASGPASTLVASEGQGELTTVDSPSDLTWPEYVQKVKETFIKAKPITEVSLYAGSMGFRDWMDYVIKLLPKDVKIQGEVNFRHLVAELGPVDKEKYRLLDVSTIDAEFSELCGDC